MKVAHIICAFTPYKSGMGNTVENFVEILSELGEQITVLTPDCGKRGEEEKKLKFEIKRLKPFLRYGNAAFIPQIYSELKNFDIIHLHYPFFGAMEIVLLKKILEGKKMELVVHYHMDPVASGLRGLIFKVDKFFMLPALFEKADAIVCSSLDYLKNSISPDLYEKNKNKIAEIPFGVDLNRFSPKAIYSPAKKILFVGGLDKAHYFKGLENLLYSLRDLPGAFLTIIGSGDLEMYYKKIAKKLNLEDRINFAGKVSDKDLPNFFKEANVLALPSVNQGEAFGTVLLEALASGTPVVASLLPGVRTVFENGKQGFLIKAGDIKDLTEKLKIILSDKKLEEEMGRAGRKLAEEKYNWHELGKKMQLIYKSLSKKYFK